jgi:hypothetical protein
VRLVVAALFAASLAGCGKRGTDATAHCADAAHHQVDALLARPHAAKLDEIAPRLRALIANRCADDTWPAEAIDCTAKAASMDDVRACRAKLTADQRSKIQADELELYTDASGPPGFGSAAPPPASPEIEKLQAELRDLNTQLADAVKKGDQGAIRDLQAKMADINAKLSAARSAPAP